MKTPERSWLEYFGWVDPDLPYMRLFRSIVQVAYVALGGDVVDQCLAGARRMDEDYQREQAMAQLAEQMPSQDSPFTARDTTREKQRRPVGHREGAGARRDCFKYEEGGRRRFEQACELVRKLFRSVLGYDAVIPREPEDSPEQRPEDPALVQKIHARAANLQNLRPPVARPTRPLEAGGPPVDTEMMRENMMLRQQLREAGVEIHEMHQTIGAMHRMMEGHVPPDRMAGREDAPAHAPSHTSAATLREEGPYTKLLMSPTEPTAETLAKFPAQEREQIRAMWHHVQYAEKAGVSKDLMRKAVLGDMQARQEVDRLLAQTQPVA